MNLSALFAQNGAVTITYYPNGDSVINAEALTDTIYPCNGWTGIGRFVNGKKEGFWQYFCNNVPMYSGTYRSGKKEGKWEMNWSGYITYRNDLLDGEAIYYYVNTTTVEQRRHYSDGKAQGDWYVYDMDGKVIETRHYRNGYPIGIWDIHEGELERKGSVNEYGYHGKWVVTIHDTIVGGGNYVNGLQDGNWIDVYARGVYETGCYHNGLKQGLWKSFDPYGYTRSTQYADGQKNGSDTLWYNGNVKSIYQWWKNEWTGVNTIYFQNGNIQEQNSIENNVLMHTEYYDNDKVAAHGKLDVNPDYIIWKAHQYTCAIAVPFEYDFELMERGVCSYSCVFFSHEEPSISVDSVAHYLRSEQFSLDTAGPHRPFGTPQFARSGTWTFYWENGNKKEEGEYLPVVSGLTYLDNLSYQKTGWWKIYDEKGILLSEELFENGTLLQTVDRKK